MEARSDTTMGSRRMETNTRNFSHAACSSAKMSFFVVSAFVLELFCSFTVFLFALVCSTLGAVAGAAGGLQTGSGFLRGSVVGALLGFTLSSQIIALALSLCDSEVFAIGFFVPLVAITSNILKERLARHRVDASVPVLEEPALVQDVRIGQIRPNWVCGSSKSSKGCITDGIPRILLTPSNLVDTLWNGGACSVCLQEYELEEVVWRLPGCCHVFHSSCIRRWLAGHRSCPLCRTNL